MSGELPERVTCEICGTSFDPTESRGWCPNAACGKWQHPAFPLRESTDSPTGKADGGVDTPTKSCPSCGKDVRADANFCKFCSHEFTGEDDAPPDEPTSSGGIDECPDCGADLSSIPPERLSNCPICSSDLSDVISAQSEPEVTPSDLTDCPACDADLTGIPEDMRMVCPDCRIDLREAIETYGPDGEQGGKPPASGQPAQSPEPTEEGQPTEPSEPETGGEAGESVGQEADEPVDTIKGIGASYADRLAEAGVETVGDLVTADPAELSAATDISEKRLGEWVERAPLERVEAVEEPAAGAGDEATAGESTPESGQAADPGQVDQGGQSTGQGGQPPGQAEQPTGQGGQPTDQGGQPSGQEDQPTGQAGQSPGQSGQPLGQGGQPTGQGGQPSGQAGRSQGQGGQPTGTGAGQPSGQPGREGAAPPETHGQPSYDTLVMEVMGQDIRASPGETLGREIRTAMVEAGAPDDDAVYIHREHLRVEEDGGTFYLRRLGQNSLKINDEPVGKNERAPVTDGDVVAFSEVVTATAHLE